jgi:hypothetical protein
MEADGHAVSGDCVEDRGEDDVAEMDGMAPQERDGDRDAATGDTMSSAVMTRPTTAAPACGDD